MVISGDPADSDHSALQAFSVILRGRVQGVGYRPFIRRLAGAFGVSGYVCNQSGAVFLHAEGTPERLAGFLSALESARPKHAADVQREVLKTVPRKLATFTIVESEPGGEDPAPPLPDLATCSDCLTELFDRRDRRYLYPFISCVSCGPRYSIVTGMPYDRERTSMSRFPLCVSCRKEYEDPHDRRFHSQTQACAECGPRLELCDSTGRPMASSDEAVATARALLAQGRILAVKGVGGYHLAANAYDDAVVQVLRSRKQRKRKPFALMYSAISELRRDADATEMELQLLSSPAAPIVIVQRSTGSSLASAIAPGMTSLGVMLPYTPLHYLLLSGLTFPLVMTSGNFADEPICYDDLEALSLLSGVADAFLTHNRPIVRPLDDSIVSVIAGHPTVLRLGRGHAPFNVSLPGSVPDIVACGGDERSTVAVGRGSQIFVGGHLGSLRTVAAETNHQRAADDLTALCGAKPAAIACDLHPDYRSARLACARGSQSNIPVHKVQHHLAHVLSCMAEHKLAPPALGIAWDGTGFGPDGTIWGGEFLEITESEVRHVARLRRFALPGGEAAIRNPRRIALALLFDEFDEGEVRDLAARFLDLGSAQTRVMLQMLETRTHCPLTSSIGRLYDGVAALLGLVGEIDFEAEAAMKLEQSTAREVRDRYPFKVLHSSGIAPHVLDWGTMLRALLQDIKADEDRAIIAARFQNTLAEAAATIAGMSVMTTVALSGGCFQNRYLAERMAAGLRCRGRTVYLQHSIPPNDGSLSVGQLLAVARTLQQEDSCV